MRETLDMSAAGSGVFLSFSTAGALLGGLVVARSGADRIHAGMRWAPAVAGAGALAATFFGRTPWLLASALIVFGLGFTVYLRSAGLVVQLRAPKSLLGTWNGLIDAVVRTVSAAGILASSFLFDVVGGRSVYAVLGLLLLVTAALWTSFGTEKWQQLTGTALHRPDAAEDDGDEP
ncbi:hypothetical protein, partial [Streptomyces neyagawaensis]